MLAVWALMCDPCPARTIPVFVMGVVDNFYNPRYSVYEFTF